MENFTFYAPTYFAFGKDTENDTGLGNGGLGRLQCH